MSFEDSLSESILSQQHGEPEHGLEDLSELFDEVQSLQNEMQHSIDKKEAQTSESKLTKIKGILLKVNRDLAKEKQYLSNFKLTQSQSLSQIENNVTEKEMRDRAKKLVLYQKRLLNAFKVQKSIVTNLKQISGPIGATNRKLRENTQENAGKEANIQRNDKKIIKVQENDDTQLTSSNSQQAIIADNNPCPSISSQSFVVIDRKTHEASTAAASNRASVQTIPASIKTQNINAVVNSKEGTQRKQHTGTKVQHSKLPACSDPTSKFILLKINTPFVQKGQGNEKESTSTEKQRESNMLQPLLSHLKQPNTVSPDNKRKHVAKRKRPVQKAINSKQMVQENSKVDKNQSQTVSQPTNIQGIIDGNQSAALPYLNPVFEKQGKNQNVDIMSLKFIVTMKDEEFVPSAQFLPKDFWKAKWNSEDYIIDQEFLKKMDFMDFNSS
ncbi:uncharacterized protein LOC135683721 [Rhopilema esculentum]|uniref:uncharacterized protein LOC135683721 n=1 Tax=Rhopilema esculentum TaxID=499914 RepID=UPI0031D276A5